MSIADELARIAAKSDEVPRARVKRKMLTQRNARASAVLHVAGLVAKHDAAEQAARFSSLADDDVIFVEAVLAVCGLTEPTLYRWLRKAAFPAPVEKKSSGASARNRWRVGDVRAWLEARR